MRRSMIRPASNATASGANADSPTAIESAFTNSSIKYFSVSKYFATVDFPAPFGPARIIKRRLIAVNLVCRNPTVTSFDFVEEIS